MVKLSLIVYLLFIPLLLAGPEYKLFKTIDIKGNYFTTDPLNNFYVINNQEIIKFNSSGVQQSVYSNNYLGNIDYTDASDPFRTMLFYKDFNQIIFLDKTMTEIGSAIVLDDLGVDMVDVACSSSLGGFWLYNNQLQQLQYFDTRLQLTHQSVSLSTLTESLSPPDFLVEKNDKLYLGMPGTGIIIFDRYGTYYKTIKISGNIALQPQDNTLIYYKDGKLIRYDPKLLSSSEFPLPDTNNVINARIEQPFLYLFKETAVCIYKSAK